MVKKFKLNAPKFSPPENVMASLLSFGILVANKATCLLLCVALCNLYCQFPAYFTLSSSDLILFDLLCLWSKWYSVMQLCGVILVLSLQQCHRTSCKVCNCFLLTKDKDSHLLSVSCRGKECSGDSRWGDCHDWDDGMWLKVNDYHVKLAA